MRVATTGDTAQQPHPAECATARPGLVICATTVRVSESAGSGPDIGSLWAPRFPSPDLLAAAAGLFQARPHWNGEEGPRPRIVIAPGVIALERPDLARRERALARAEHRRELDVQLLAARLLAGEDDDRDEPETTQITGWSRRSRARMIRRLAEIDWTEMFGRGLPAMVTLTYPGDWETVVPTGRAAKRHLQTFFKRFARAWGVDWVGVWKLEFQRRGAPHMHLFMVPPQGLAGAHLEEEHRAALAAWVPGSPKPRRRPVAFDGLPFYEWLSATWADIVAHPDPEQRRRHQLAGTGVDFAEGMRSADPKRLAIYFAKHGTYAAKEYQHDVPKLWQEPGAGPGRFWGYRGLSPVRQQVELDWDEYLLISRTLRRLSQRTRVWDHTEKAYVWRKSMRYARVPRRPIEDPVTGEVRHRQMRRVLQPVRRLRGSSGFVTLNDGPATASALARLRAACLVTEP